MTRSAVVDSAQCLISSSSPEGATRRRSGSSGSGVGWLHQALSAPSLRASSSRPTQPPCAICPTRSRTLRRLSTSGMARASAWASVPTTTGWRGSTSCRPAYRADRKSTRLNSSHTEIYTLSLHDALPISQKVEHQRNGESERLGERSHHDGVARIHFLQAGVQGRSEEHTSELQSHRDLHSFPTRRSSDLSEG